MFGEMRQLHRRYIVHLLLHPLSERALPPRGEFQWIKHQRTTKLKGELLIRD
jgi:hypothetical protein